MPKIVKKRAYNKTKLKSSKPKANDPIFELMEGIPKSKFGLSDSAYNSLTTNLKAMKPDKNHLVVPKSHKVIVGKIIRRDFPEYSVAYHTNEDKQITSIWRKA